MGAIVNENDKDLFQVVKINFLQLSLILPFGEIFKNILQVTLKFFIKTKETKHRWHGSTTSIFINGVNPVRSKGSQYFDISVVPAYPQVFLIIQKSQNILTFWGRYNL